MTFKELNKLRKKYNISKDVKLMHDDGCVHGITKMNGIFYSAKMNTLIFTQEKEAEPEFGTFGPLHPLFNLTDEPSMDINIKHIACCNRI